MAKRGGACASLAVRADAFVARSAAIILHSWRINESRWLRRATDRSPHRVAVEPLPPRISMRPLSLSLSLIPSFLYAHARIRPSLSTSSAIHGRATHAVRARSRARASGGAVRHARTSIGVDFSDGHEAATCPPPSPLVETRHYARARNISLECKRRIRGENAEILRIERLSLRERVSSSRTVSRPLPFVSSRSRSRRSLKTEERTRLLTARYSLFFFAV